MSAPIYPPHFDPEAPLTPAQIEFACKLFKRLEQLRTSGVKHALVTLTRPDEPWRVGSVSRRFDII